MATVVYIDGTEEFTLNFAEVAAADWSQIDHVELDGCGRTFIATSPAEFWRQVRELAGVVGVS